MAEERDSMSPTKIGFSILWSACWTGMVVKSVFAVLLLTMGLVHFEGRFGLAVVMLLISPVTVFAIPIIMAVFGTHFGEGIGLEILFWLSIPVDIWALGLVGRTFFLERLRKEPPEGLGLAIWWRAALVGAFFLPALWGAVSFVTDNAITASHSMAEIESLRHLFDNGLPIAERIGLELTIWGTISSALLTVLSLIGVSIFGQIIRRISEDCKPTSESYQGLITRWDLMRVPTDQGLLLTTLAGVGIVFSVMFWSILPVTTPHPHDCCKKPDARVEPAFKPVESLNSSAQRVATLAAQIETMEQQKVAAKDQKTKGKGKTEGGTIVDSTAKAKP
ncbi:conserved membrane hypothetical protein [Candidatus Nitrospira nitrificans]|uniref:Uncharacterized protein n=2 Tax=Candidatus Nitrospira nitrificans TaxID=1742973 RepID=A0A0S4LNL4_9BACT|nr:conserved membrane hypothetical protein [Candidatus Nitrospira nitrificans]